MYDGGASSAGAGNKSKNKQNIGNLVIIFEFTPTVMFLRHHW
jgi:hypothetical protein